MFVPIYDENRLRSIPFQYMTIAIIAINIAVFLLFQLGDVLSGDLCGQVMFAKTYGLVPLELMGTPVAFAECPASMDTLSPIPEPATLATYMFLHGDALHLIGNMLFLWVFGDNVEDALGHVRYVVFYVLCGVAAALLHFWLQPDSTSPLIGASGAISGVVAAYLVLHPRVNVWVLFLRVIPLKLHAIWVLGAWILMNISLAVLPYLPGLAGGLGASPEISNVAWAAHVGGIVAGAILVIVMRPAGTPLLDRDLDRR